jgi:hypothetical protein
MRKSRHLARKKIDASFPALQMANVRFATTMRIDGSLISQLRLEVFD